MTKNLFEFATKELSQDAFLRWLFENWNSDQNDVRLTSRTLITEVFGTEINFDKVVEFKTRAQERKIDLVINFKAEDVQYTIIIEDKTYTMSHDDQLNIYKSYVDKKYKDNLVKFVYYKSNIISNDERLDVEKNGWEVFDINRINGIFSDSFIYPKNNILCDYVEHIAKLYNDLTQELPMNVSDWNMNHWVNFYYNNNLKIPEKIAFGYNNYRGQYIYLVFNIKEMWQKNPYGEIRSRDFTRDSKFTLRILMYDTEQEYLNKYLNEWKAKFGSSELFMLQNYKQQLAISLNSDEVYNKKDLEKNLQKYIDEYARLMI